MDDICKNSKLRIQGPTPSARTVIGRFELIFHLKMQQLALLFEEPEIQAGQDLQALFRELNREHWRGKLPEFRCEWSDRMISTWGACYRGKQLIRISSFFKTRPSAELTALLCHEMIHIKYAGHGPRFKKELRRIGMKGDVQKMFPHLNDLTNALRRPHRYIYECKECRLRIRRRRKVRGYCAECWNRGVHSHFRLLAGHDSVFRKATGKRHKM